MISVIVPIYQVEPYLSACVDSILAQTESDLEVILVDDGSPDSCGILCDQYAAKDSRVTVIHQKNAGLSAARNIGLRAAKGDYYAFVDSDDVLHPDYLKVLLKNAEESGAQVSMCRYQKFPQDGSFLCHSILSDETVRLLSGRDASKLIVRDHIGSCIMSMAKIYSSSMHDFLLYPDRKLHEDQFVTYKVLYQAASVAVSDLRLYGYRQRNDSIMHQFNIKRLDILEALEEAISFFDQYQDAEMKEYAEKRYLINLEICCYKLWKNGFLKNDIFQKLVVKHKDFWNQHQKNIRTKCSMLEAFSIDVFLVSPFIYSLLADLYLKILPED